MFKTAFTAAAALLALPAATLPVAAQAEDARNFSHEGIDYAYTAEKKGNITVIKGTASDNVPFHLIVSGNRVSGTYNYQNVNFKVSDSTQALESTK
jgi:hypothetical protein